MIHGPSPAPDAALFNFGKRRMLQTVRGAIGAFVLALAMPIAGVVHEYGLGTWVFAVIWFLVFGGAGVGLAWVGWADRHAYLAFDATGVWLHKQTARAVIPWASLESAGLFWCPQGPDNSGKRLVSLELCPAGGVDEHDPALSPLIVHDEPNLPGVADRRYRVGIPVFALRLYGPKLVEAARSRAGRLWFGEHERPSGYLRLQDLFS
ncbi:hypothetical protein QOM21_03625 [Streptomyces sp. Pv4-95]|uniref:hypothetical protein n=1 Tax=Streptomyces sp. Pv4-95 TaxID=3049543 RepID=UPI00389131B5